MLSLQTCSSGHDEIVYLDNGGYKSKCPMCEALATIEQLESSVKNYEEELELCKDKYQELYDIVISDCPEILI